VKHIVCLIIKYVAATSTKDALRWWKRSACILLCINLPSRARCKNRRIDTFQASIIAEATLEMARYLLLVLGAVLLIVECQGRASTYAEALRDSSKIHSAIVIAPVRGQCPPGSILDPRTQTCRTLIVDKKL
jgi:hypothetical protein